MIYKTQSHFYVLAWSCSQDIQGKFSIKGEVRDLKKKKKKKYLRCSLKKKKKKNAVESGPKRAPQHKCSQSAVGGVYTYDGGGGRQEGDLKKDCRKR